ncbi:MAG TPA: hypothetical protein VFS55_02585 [Dokdonella sp.]|nr:hypothetical protein [Dokdonella sp.]
MEQIIFCAQGSVVESICPDGMAGSRQHEVGGTSGAAFEGSRSLAEVVAGELEKTVPVIRHQYPAMQAKAWPG